MILSNDIVDLIRDGHNAIAIGALADQKGITIPEAVDIIRAWRAEHAPGTLSDAEKAQVKTGALTINEAADRIRARIAEHDGKLSEDEVNYVAGLRDALALVTG